MDQVTTTTTFLDAESAGTRTVSSFEVDTNTQTTSAHSPSANSVLHGDVTSNLNAEGCSASMEYTRNCLENQHAQNQQKNSTWENQTPSQFSQDTQPGDAKSAHDQTPSNRSAPFALEKEELDRLFLALII